MTSRTAELLAILQKSFHPREEGWIWLAAYLEDTEGGTVSQFEGAYEQPLATARGLAEIMNGCGADRTYLAICRRDGKPTEADREMWRELRSLVDSSLLLDMVVFNRREAWSMRSEDAAAAMTSGGGTL
ncbi:MAG TPA: hypothetical protein VFA70_01685 [Dehalococcoidia bacterium]|nr:hypothetical protein [Dehalococcoidia bacterium]